MANQNVIIVGGGGAGVALARELSAKLDASRYSLILITLNDRYVHLPAFLRMTVESEDAKELEQNALIPYDSLFVKGNGRVKIGKVVGIEKDTGSVGGQVVLDDGDKVPFTYLILATGSKWEGPLSNLGSRSAISAGLKQWRAAFDNAQSIVLAGGGAVGLELAGELRDIYPKKKITIVHAGDLPLNDVYPEKFRRNTLKRWQDRNIEFILDDRIDNIPTGEFSSVQTVNGKTVSADLVVPTRGGVPNTDFLRPFDSAILDDYGRVRVRPTLQLEKYLDIFAAGDILAFNEQKQLAKVGGHAGVIAANIISLTQSKEPKKLYKGAFEGVLVTNGKRKGFGYMDVLWGVTLGDTLASALKSKSLFVSMQRKNMGLPA